MEKVRKSGRALPRLLLEPAGRAAVLQGLQGGLGIPDLARKIMAAII